MSQCDFFRYLPVDDDSMRWGAYLTSVGRVHIPGGASYPPAGHPAIYDFKWHRGRVLPEFGIVLITMGSGTFDSKESGEVRFSGPSVFLLFPGVWHRYRPSLDAGWTERWICFNGEIAHRIVAGNLLTQKQPVLTVNHSAALTRQFDEVIDFARTSSAHDTLLLSLFGLGLVAHTVAHTARHCTSNTAKSDRSATNLDDPIVRKAVDFIWNYSHRSLSVRDVARALSVPRRTLDRRFRCALGHSVLDEINTCRLSRAKRLLEETELPLKAVAYLAGFSGAERMRLLFRSKESVLPSDHRRRAR